MMSKRKIVSIALVLVLCALTVTILCACGEQLPIEPKVYTIQYSDDAGKHTISVKKGELYSIEKVPSRKGHNFTGLYDSRVGGTQYVDKDGICLSAFSGNSDLILYPQFEAKEFRLVLNYQEASTPGIRQLIVRYGEQISELPLSVYADNKVFAGWYTKPNKGGTQVSDGVSIIPQNSFVSEETFDLSNPNGLINLYAGFDYEKYLVKFYVKDDPNPEEYTLAYGTKISTITTKKRVDGKGVMGWSQFDGGSDIYDGIITGSMSFYSSAYGSVIEFDTDGGYDEKDIVAKENAIVHLPQPTKPGYGFLGWFDQKGTKYPQTINMPTNGLSLHAKWIIAVSMTRYSCKDNTGYNKYDPETNQDWKKRHNGWELGELVLDGCEKVGDKYKVVNQEEFALKYHFLHDTNNLPTVGGNGHASICDDTFNWTHGTGINSRIGHGAYWVRVTYRDNSTREFHATNQFRDKNTQSYLGLVSNGNLDSTKQIAKIEVNIFYELLSTGNGFLGIQWKETPNWRCEYTFNFS